MSLDWFEVQDNKAFLSKDRKCIESFRAMTLKKEKKKFISKKVGNKTTVKTVNSTEEAPKSQVRIPGKVSKEPKHSDKLESGVFEISLGLCYSWKRDTEIRAL